MDKDKLIEIAFTEWKANFKTGDKKTKNARVNFENLFQTLKDLGATFEDLYDTYLPKAIKVHQPVPSKIKETYATLDVKKYKTFQEFSDEWLEAIESTGTEVFFEFFKALPEDHDGEPKVFGNMSASEYRAQRRYADQFPELDTRELVKAWREQKKYKEIEVLEENILDGNKDETNSGTN